MAIELRGTPKAASALNGDGVTLTFDTGAGAPLEGDLVVVYGGHPHLAGAPLGPSTAGYTAIASHTAAAPNFGVWYKTMGVTPDLTVTCQGDARATHATAYGAYVFIGTGLDATLFDQTATTAGPTTSTNPNPPSILTQTANAMVVAMAGSTINDTARGTVLNYSNLNGASGNDTIDMSCDGATRIIASPATEDPPAWSTWASGAWYSVTIALKPAAGPPAVTGTAAMSVALPTLAAIGTLLFTGVGALAGFQPTLAATGTVTPPAVTGNAAVVWERPAIAASGTQNFTGTGALLVPQPIISGGATPPTTGTVALTFGTPAFGAEAVLQYVGVAELAYAPPTIAASGTVTFSGDTVQSGFRPVIDALGTVTNPAPEPEVGTYSPGGASSGRTRSRKTRSGLSPWEVAHDAQAAEVAESEPALPCRAQPLGKPLRLAPIEAPPLVLPLPVVASAPPAPTESAWVRPDDESDDEEAILLLLEQL